MYQMLAIGRADILIEESEVADLSIKRLGLESKIIKTEGIVDESQFYILFSKKSPHRYILDRLNDVLNEMHSDGTIKTILAQYKM